MAKLTGEDWVLLLELRRKHPTFSDKNTSI
jgi:hypothetical protein